MILTCATDFYPEVVSGPAGTGQVIASLGMPVMSTLTLSRMSLGETAQVIESLTDKLSIQTGLNPA